ncbi:MAG: hypothetical protein AAB289_00265 [Chloroflexota bacterium]
MSSFTVPIEVAATRAGPFVAIDAVVDTGAFYSWVPRSILERLGIEPVEVQGFGLAEGGSTAPSRRWSCGSTAAPATRCAGSATRAPSRCWVP